MINNRSMSIWGMAMYTVGMSHCIHLPITVFAAVIKQND